MTMGLQATQLSSVREQKSLFHDLHFTIEPGEVLLIEGPNGSGKSSLLQILAGLSSNYEGYLSWNGQRTNDPMTEYGHDLHYLSHQNGLKLGLTVIENLTLALHLAQKSINTNCDEILAKLSLLENKHSFVKQLSAGQKRRVALARLFLIPKRVWILDEPFTAIDVSCQQLFLDHLDLHLNQAGIAILSSHHPLTFKNHTVKKVSLGL